MSYCEICEAMYVEDYVIPNSCKDHIKCICKHCWENIFRPKFKITEDLVYDITGQHIKNKTYYEKIADKPIHCLKCNKIWTQYDTN